MPAKKPNRKSKPNNCLDVYRNHHQWDTTKSKRTLDQTEVDYYINNDLDLNELYDNMKLYDYSTSSSRWKNKNGCNLNSQMKAKKDKEE